MSRVQESDNKMTYQIGASVLPTAFELFIRDVGVTEALKNADSFCYYIQELPTQKTKC